MTKHNSHPFSLLKLYFTLISIAGAIGMVIGYGIALSQLFTSLILTEDEYVAGNYLYYEIQNCETVWMPGEKMPAEPESYTGKTEQEIALCKQQVKQKILDEKGYKNKTNIIMGTVRGTLFLILFITHFPAMRKENKDE